MQSLKNVSKRKQFKTYFPLFLILNPKHNCNNYLVITIGCLNINRENTRLKFRHLQIQNIHT